MAITDIRMTVLGLINEVERKMGFTPVSTTLNDTSWTPVALQLLNEVADDLADSGNWNETRQTITVTAVTGQATYALPASGAIVQHITDIAYTGRVAGLRPVTFEVIKLLNRTSAFGAPNQWAAVEVNASGDPVIEVYPIPGTAEASAADAFTVHALTKPRIWAVGDETVVPPFPAMVMVVGLHAKALLEENGGEPTRESEKQERAYERMKREAINRFTVDTATAIRFVPRRGYP